MTHRLELRLFGKPQLVQNGSPLTIKSAKAQALLVYLALNPRAHSRESLAGLLWGDTQEEMARGNLRKVLTVLRRSVGDHLDIQRREIRFVHDANAWVDVIAFEEASAEINSLRTAIDLYQADFLQDFVVPLAPDFSLWMLAQRERLRLRMLDHLQTVTAQLEQTGAVDAALGYARRWLAVGPWEERAHRAVMQLLALSGERTAALKQFERCQQVLMDELGVAVSAETETLHQKILANAFATPQAVPHNLPNPATPLHGRENDLTTIRNTFANPDCRLLTLLGAGGIGKSRLAIAAGHAARNNPAFADGIYFVPLAAATNTSTLLTTIANAISLQLNGKSAPLPQIKQHLRDRRWLIVLDNFEQLTKSAATVLDLLNACPNLSLLVTSRRRLALFEESIVMVDALTQAAAFDLFAGLASRWDPAFSAETNTTHITRICKLTDGIPLALELAAARTLTQSCATIADQLATSADMLATHSPSLPQRQRTLRTVFNDSWRLLAEREQQTLAAVAVFRGGFSAEAAKHVADTNRQVIDQLVHNSLLQRTPTNRYDLHQTIRQYAWEMHADPDATQTAHATYYFDLLQQACGDNGALDIAIAKALIPDINNLRAAWRWSIEHRLFDLIQSGATTFNSLFLKLDLEIEGEQLFAQASAALADMPAYDQVRTQIDAMRAYYLRGIGRVAEAIALQEQCLSAFMRLEDDYGISKVSTALAFTLMRQGKYDASLHHAKRGLAVAQQLGNARLTGDAYNSVGVTALSMGDYATAQDAFEKRLVIEREGNGNGLGTALNNLGYLHTNKKEFDQAAEYYQQAMDVYQATGSRRHIALGKINLGAVAYQRGHYSLAIEHIEQSLALRREIGDQRGMVACLSNLGAINITIGQLGLAQQQLRESFALVRQLDSGQATMTALLQVVMLHQAHKQWCNVVRLGTFILLSGSAHADVIEKVEGALANAAEQLDASRYAACEAEGARLTKDACFDMVEKTLSQ